MIILGKKLKVSTKKPKAMKQGKGKFISRGKPEKFFVYLPKLVVLDSAWPFKPGEDLLVSIDGDKVILSRWKK